MSKLFTVARLSPHIEETPQGYLLCRDVAITRAGELVYLAAEVPEVEPGPDGKVRVTRSVADIHDPQTIASFEGQPVTMGHPAGFVGPDNWKNLASGISINVRPGNGSSGDRLVADLLITDLEAVDYIKRCKDRGQLPEVSCGYEADFEQVSPGLARQKRIRGNHVALVTFGRAGSECAIRDQNPEARRVYDEAIPQETPPVKKPTLLERIKTFVTRDEAATPDAIRAELARLEAEEAAAAVADAEPTPPPAEGQAQPAPGAQPAGDPIAEKLDAVLAALAKLIEMQAGGATPAPAASAAPAADEAPDPAAQQAQDADPEVRSLAEILAPGIAPGADIAERALATYGATEEGKAFLTPMLAGKALDAVPAEVSRVIFRAAAAHVTEIRKAALETTDRKPNPADAAPKAVQTAEELVDAQRKHRAAQKAA